MNPELLRKERCGLELSGGGKVEITPHGAQTKHRTMLLDSWNEFRFAEKSSVTNKPDYWSVERLQASPLLWKTEVCGTTARGNTAPKDAVQMIIIFRMFLER